MGIIWYCQLGWWMRQSVRCLFKSHKYGRLDHTTNKYKKLKRNLFFKPTRQPGIACELNGQVEPYNMEPYNMDHIILYNLYDSYDMMLYEMDHIYSLCLMWLLDFIGWKMNKKRKQVFLWHHHWFHLSIMMLLTTMKMKTAKLINLLIRIRNTVQFNLGRDPKGPAHVKTTFTWNKGKSRSAFK